MCTPVAFAICFRYSSRRPMSAWPPSTMQVMPSFAATFTSSMIRLTSAVAGVCGAGAFAGRCWVGWTGGNSIERCSWNKVTPLARASGDRSFRIVRTMAPLANVTFLAGDAAACHIAAFPALASDEDRRPSPAPAPSKPIASRRFISPERRLRVSMTSELRGAEFRQTADERRGRREPLIGDLVAVAPRAGRGAIAEVRRLLQHRDLVRPERQRLGRHRRGIEDERRRACFEEQATGRPAAPRDLPGVVGRSE